MRASLLAKHPTVFGTVPHGARPPCFLSSGQEFCNGEYVSLEEINDGTGTSALRVEDEYRGTLSSTRVTHVSGLFCYLSPRPFTSQSLCAGRRTRRVHSKSCHRPLILSGSSERNSG